MSPTGVDRLYLEFSEIIEHLEQTGQVSLRSVADENFRKGLLLAAASYFEVTLVDSIIDFVRGQPPGNHLAAEFVRRKALSRQFHSLFDWNSSNANQFYALFGDTFRQFMKRELAGDLALAKGVSAFIEIGRERNRVVHQNYGSLALEKTTEEIFYLYQQARLFVDTLPAKLNACAEGGFESLDGQAD